MLYNTVVIYYRNYIILLLHNTATRITLTTSATVCGHGAVPIAVRRKVWHADGPAGNCGTGQRHGADTAGTGQNGQDKKGQTSPDRTGHGGDTARTGHGHPLTKDDRARGWRERDMGDMDMGGHGGTRTWGTWGDMGKDKGCGEGWTRRT